MPSFVMFSYDQMSIGKLNSCPTFIRVKSRDIIVLKIIGTFFYDMSIFTKFKTGESVKFLVTTLLFKEATISC